MAYTQVRDTPHTDAARDGNALKDWKSSNVVGYSSTSIHRDVNFDWNGSNTLSINVLNSSTNSFSTTNIILNSIGNSDAVQSDIRNASGNNFEVI